MSVGVIKVPEVSFNTFLLSRTEVKGFDGNGTIRNGVMIRMLLWHTEVLPPKPSLLLMGSKWLESFRATRSGMLLVLEYSMQPAFSESALLIPEYILSLRPTDSATPCWLVSRY